MHDHRFTLDDRTGAVTPPGGPASGSDALRLYASGDIIWERDLQAYLLDRPPEHPLGEMAKLWADGDVVFAQLETCFGEARDPQLADKRISYLTDPRLLPHFAAGGFDLACLASNHTMDNGHAPIAYTRAALAERGIACSGSGRNLAEARAPARLERRGFKVALCSYATADAETDAGPDRPGNAPWIRESVVEDVGAARAAGADFVLVSVHKGREFVYHPHPEHQADCRAIVDAGADVILGHHPHFLQGMEWRRRGDRTCLIFYSLGSLLVDYEPPLSRYELSLFERSQRNNVVARVDLTEAGVVGLSLTPVRQTEDWRVRLETPAEAAETFALVRRISAPLNRPEISDRFWATGWAYLAIQYPSIWMHLRNRPSYLKSALRWFFREETFRLHWGALFGRDAPRWLLAARRGLHRALRGLMRRLRGRG